MKIKRVEHIAIAVDSLGESIDFMRNTFGLRLEYSEIPKIESDSYQTPYLGAGTTRLTQPASLTDSTTSGGMPTGVAGSQMVTPMPTCSMPVTSTMSGAAPCTGSNMLGKARSGLMLPEGAMPMVPVVAGPRSERMSPNRLEPTTTSNQSGC